MHDARDVEDTRLLDEGLHDQLLAGYFHQIRERCFLKTRNRDAGDELAQQICERLLRELRSGKRYPVPFRVVVGMVIEWSARGFFAGNKVDRELPEDWEETAADEFGTWEERHDLDQLFADLPGRQREVARLRYLAGLDRTAIAAELGIEPNAVDQALHNAHRKLAERLVA